MLFITFVRSDDILEVYLIKQAIFSIQGTPKGHINFEFVVFGDLTLNIIRPLKKIRIF
jgi:hypothetical protein